jgi:hypothetical protein
MEQSASEAKVKVKVAMGAEKIHGPNSPDVLSGKVQVGHREKVEMENPGPTVREVGFTELSSLIGEEEAKKVFRDQGVDYGN